METVKFADVGEGITEGHIQKILVKDGDQVKEDQPLMQVETDKAVVNIPSIKGGTVKVVAKENTDIKVGDILAYVGTPDELKNAPSAGAAAPQPSAPKAQEQNKTQEASAGAPAKPQAETKPASSPTQQGAPHPEILTTPFVRKLAEQLKVDLAQIKGTGPNGRIMEVDVRDAAKETSDVLKKPRHPEILAEKHGEEIEHVPLSPVRKAIAKNMEASWTIPRASHIDLIDASELNRIVSEAKDKFLKQFNIKLTFLPILIKATVAALKDNPHFNASYDPVNREILVKHYYNIGLGAETKDGLKVIVIKDADKKSIVQIARDLADLRDKLYANTITLDDMKDSSFTITNAGSLGGGFIGIPMINPPDVAILAFSMMKDMPVAVDGKVEIRKILPFTLTFDHRVVDGAEAVKFGNELKGYIEDPEFLEMGD
ncbi:2-oxoacid dehydrogenase multienzyme complex, dihydrolipoyl acyltransferase (E2) component [Candidatus Mancarchaeum acidiphilum]|uniref:2-oxoacid dehydrogenase multienzyme complex, dihydrolipoyl acyltransferase (E2) component n=1 Tax=Candidatus Mancarchaeum acidiphilum TaxID=1920749 RepID=A0A218NN27_9ARCH|nr:dihydrolipoamide acetyltransferase family protein [Candidatus Mancarchaeum acidiphilum]ASI13862.1 2-oxoacid dehydrogenase multienzyme complex, dihydrolipoyl acyltransferase (E2) component [Candidatus Mancarchaeum acidiphilum]